MSSDCRFDRLTKVQKGTCTNDNMSGHSGYSIKQASNSVDQLPFAVATRTHNSGRILDAVNTTNSSDNHDMVNRLGNNMNFSKHFSLVGIPSICSPPTSASLSGMLRPKVDTIANNAITPITIATTTTRTTGSLSPSATSNISSNDSLAGKACSVCGDLASGLHYGVLSCEGCKAFFKRSIQSCITYTCPSDNRCKIDKQRRKCCQACRLQKCFNVGMIKEGVRKNRNPGGRVKYQKPASMESHTEDSNNSAMTIPSESPTYSHDEIEKEDDDSPGVPVYADSNDSSDLRLTLIPDFEINCDIEVLKEFTENGEKFVVDRTGARIIIVNDIIKKLLEAEPPMLPACPDPDAEECGIRTITIICEMVERELVMVIDWAKRIPGYTHLCLNDQVVLLQASWLEVFMIDLAFRSMPYENKLVYACDMVMGQKQSEAAGLDEINNHAFQLVAKYKNISMDKQEFACLKAITLVNSDLRNLTDRCRVESVQDTLYLALQRYTLVNYPEQPLRFAKLLMTLPELKAVSSRGIEKLFSIKVAGEVPMYNLLLEMLEANEQMQ